MTEALDSPVDLGVLSPSIDEVCRAYVQRYRAVYQRDVAANRAGTSATRAYAHAFDGLLGALYCAADAGTQRKFQGERVPSAAVAVGGYGRRTLGLHSDIDVMFLCEDGDHPYVHSLAEAVLYPLWNIGLDVGHSVRGIGDTIDLAQGDLQTATTLFDMRRIAGDAGLVDTLAARGRDEVFRPQLNTFLELLRNDARSRHQRFGDSLYLLEPEIKHGRGGLRDVGASRWAALARWDARADEDLVRTGALLAREVHELNNAHEHLWQIRNQLHTRAGRQHDRLTFEDQEELAETFGYADGLTLGVEQFMQAYYRTANTVAVSADRMLDRAMQRESRRAVNVRRLGGDEILKDDSITLSDPTVVEREPARAVRFYRSAVNHNAKPEYEVRDMIARSAHDAKWRLQLQQSEEATQLFTWLLARVAVAPFASGTVVGELYDVGIIKAMIPEFEALLGRIFHDRFHVYTADVHAVKAVELLGALARGDAPYVGLAARLAAELPQRLPVFLATLLHSVGRPRGKRRIVEGAPLAKVIATRMGLESDQAEHVEWLVLHQQDLYHYATQRDIHDAEGVREFAELVRTPERMRDLFLISVAIMSTANPKGMTSWKMRAMEDLYLAVLRTLERVDSAAPTEGRVERAKASTRVGFVGERGSEELIAFLDEMPDRYHLVFPADVVRRHARFARDQKIESDVDCAFFVDRAESEEVLDVVVTARDRVGLLADVAAAIAAQELSVIHAEVYTRQTPAGQLMFDVFTVRGGYGREHADIAEQLRDDLKVQLSMHVTGEALIARRASRPAWAVRVGPAVPTQVSVDNDASADHTVIDVFTRDQPGLLHMLAKSLHVLELNLVLAKINTEGDRVADVFYVVENSGRKVDDSERLRTIQAYMFDAVSQFQLLHGVTPK